MDTSTRLSSAWQWCGSGDGLLPGRDFRSTKLCAGGAVPRGRDDARGVRGGALPRGVEVARRGTGCVMAPVW